jgi:hypothetical protein
MTLGHIGLANDAGLTVSPLLASALGVEAAPGRLWVVAAVLPLVSMLLTAVVAHLGASGN